MQQKMIDYGPPILFFALIILALVLWVVIDRTVETLIGIILAVAAVIGGWIVLRSRKTPPKQRHIPIDAPKPLFGRDALLKTIHERLGRGESVLLYGLGGMGKTALAATVGEGALADTERCPDGVLWLTVGGRSCEDLCDEVFRRWGEWEYTRLAVEQKPAQAQRLLGNATLLIVLDDVDAGSEAALRWCRQVHPPNTPLVVTSREELAGLGGGEEVAELAREDAIALLRHHAGRAGKKLDEQSADSICGELGDHPLALQLLGGLLKDRPLDPHEALKELGAAHERIKALRLGEGAKKDDNVYVSLALSWDRLEEDQRLVLGRLAACFAPGTGSELLGMACKLEEAPFKAATETLHARSLLRERAGQWVEHALVQAFVQAALGEANWQAARAAVVWACVVYANTYNEEGREAHDQLEAEGGNLLGAMVWAAGQGMHRAVNQLAWDLWDNSNFMCTRGYVRESIPLLEAGVAAARALGGRCDEGIHLSSLGNAYWSLGQANKAVGCHEQALAISREFGDRHREGQALGNLGNAHWSLGQTNKAIGYYKQALAIIRETGDNRRVEGSILGNLGSAYYGLGQIQKAIGYYEQALVISHEFGDRSGEGTWLGNLGVAYKNLGQIEKAVEHYEQALAISREASNRRVEGGTLGNLGIIYKNLGQTEKAMEHYRQALAIAREIGDRSNEGNQLGNLGIAYADLGQAQKAMEYHEQALAIALEIGDRQGEGTWLGYLGIAYRYLGQVERAIEHYEQALAISREIGDRRGEGADLGNLGLAYESQGKIEEAVKQIEEARAIFEAIKAAHLVKWADEQLARLHGVGRV